MTAETNRQIANVINFGQISEVDCARAKARVKFGQVTTDWLPWVTFRAGSAQTWSAPTTGEQCIVLAQGGDLNMAAIILGLYTKNAPSQSADEHVFNFSDGAKITYNQASGELTATGLKTANIDAANSLTITSPTVTINGDLSVTGNIDTDKNISAKGNIGAGGDVKASNISLRNHNHIEQGDGQPTSKAK